MVQNLQWIWIAMIKIFPFHWQKLRNRINSQQSSNIILYLHRKICTTFKNRISQFQNTLFGILCNIKMAKNNENQKKTFYFQNIINWIIFHWPYFVIFYMLKNLHNNENFCILFINIKIGFFNNMIMLNSNRKLNLLRCFNKLIILMISQRPSNLIFYGRCKIQTLS